MAFKKILLVDDDPVSLQVLINYLREHYLCETAADGLLAWEILQRRPQDFAAVITDRIMPDLHGVQLLQRMQIQSDLQKIPVILLTGEAEKEEHIAAIKAGVFDFLYKPVKQQLLLAVLKRALQP